MVSSQKHSPLNQKAKLLVSSRSPWTFLFCGRIEVVRSVAGAPGWVFADTQRTVVLSGRSMTANSAVVLVYEAVNEQFPGKLEAMP